MKLIMSMKDKGFDYATIGKAMDMMGVDNKINQAKSNMYQQQFINALGAGNYAGAGAALSNLAEINKPQAAMLASYFPSFKDNWNVDVARQNAAQAHNWNRADKKEDMAMQNAYRQADLRQKIQLQEMQRQRAIDSLVSMGMSQAEASAFVDTKYRKPTAGNRSTGTGGSRASSGSTGTKDDTKDLMAIVKQAEEWDDNHPDETWKNPYREVADKAELILDGGDVPLDVDNYQSVQHWSQMVMEKNAKDGYPYTPEQLYQIIASWGGYGKNVADEKMANGSLKAYGK